MKKNLLRRLLAIVLCVSILLLAALTAGADFGDYSGDSDYGDSGWSSSDSDWSSSDSDWDTDSGSSEGVSGMTVTWVIVGILAVAFIWASIDDKKKKKKKGKTGGSAAAKRKLRPMEEYRKLDEAFEESELTAKLSNWYVQMQQCWQAKDITPIRPYCTDPFYTQMENQLRRKNQAHQTNYVERIAVLGVELRGFCQESGNDVIVARLNTRIVDYTLDDETGKLVSGDRKKEKFMTYEWDLVRPSGQKSGAAKEIQTVNCPNCGAPVEINASAKCPYCGSVITLEEHGFALNAIRAIAQETRG